MALGTSTDGAKIVNYKKKKVKNHKLLKFNCMLGKSSTALISILPQQPKPPVLKAREMGIECIS